ncbi:MAG: hypothetical protein AUH66_02035 [Acidobacteria bacterium 13_1_40CM_4_57_6]|nr:MAG: hypothetical protein AUH66_02035 [Acidobacteria bacterium 13_1_40CM_4_57_6]
MNEQDSNSWKKLQEKWLSRRNLIRGAAGTAAGARLLLRSGVRLSARADEDEGNATCGLALPLPHTTAGPFGPIHFYFPGPIDGSAAATDGTGTHAEGRDPSTITNFEGFVGQVDLTFSGTGMDTKTGATAPYTFHTDTRFMKGTFIASDERRHHGAFAFI